MTTPDEFRSHLLGYRIERDASDADHWCVLEPDGTRVPGVFDGLPAAERFIVLRELRALETRPRHPAW